MKKTEKIRDDGKENNKEETRRERTKNRKKKRQDEKNLKDRGVYTDTRGTSSNQLSIDAAGSQQSGFR